MVGSADSCIIFRMILKIIDSQVLDKAVQVLRAGGVVMHPTETCYGLAVDVRNKRALEKLYKIKGRDGKKPVSILVSSLEMARKYGEFSKKTLQLAEKYWPGPLSILVPRTKDLPEFVNFGEKFVSIRWSGMKFCSELVRKFGSPVTTTSANLSGQEPLYEADLSRFGKLAVEIDLVVDGGKVFENKPSTIVKVDGDKMKIIRQGEISLL